MKNWIFMSKGIVVGRLKKEKILPGDFKGIYDDIFEDTTNSFKIGSVFSDKIWKEHQIELQKQEKLARSNPEDLRLDATEYKPQNHLGNIKTYGNVWVRELIFQKAGDVKNGHKHEFDHLHFVSHGSVRISVYDKTNRDKILLQKEYKAPAWIKVPKEHFHDIVALEDNTRGYCIQSLLNTNNEVCETEYIMDKDWMDEVKEYEEKFNYPDETQK